jgi:4-oxalocrotonate tautomerase
VACQRAAGGRAQALVVRKCRPRESQEAAMPYVNVKLIKGVFDENQKQDMLTRLTETMVEIEGENMRPVTWVTIEEVASGEWAIGGKALTAADVKALQAG